MESIVSSIVESAISNVADEEKLISATEVRLSSVYGDDVSTPISSVEESAESTPISSVVESVESTPISSVVESAESTVSSVVELAESVVSSVVSADESPGLSDAFYRAAIHQGWKAEEIEEFYNKDPDLAKRTFAKLYDSTNKLSREFAAIGRSKQQVAQVPKVEPKPEEKKVETLDIEKLRKDYDNDPVIELVAQLYEQNKALTGKNQNAVPEEAQVNEKELRVQIQEEALMEQQIEQFFVAPDLKAYNEFYGILPTNSRDWETLSIAQKANRWSLLEMADQIILGAESQGRGMDVNEALTLAHLNVSEPMREKVIRDEIKAKVVKRSKSLTLQPTGGKLAANTGVTSQQDLETKVAERLAKTFG